MSLKLLLLKSGEDIICDVKEMAAGDDGNDRRVIAVSYTHLTLPTICSV